MFVYPQQKKVKRALRTEHYSDYTFSQVLYELRYIYIEIILLLLLLQGRERVRALYPSKDPNPTQPIQGRKKKIKQ